MRRDQGGPPLIGGRTWLSGLAACLPVLAPPRIMLRLSPPGVPDDRGCATAPPGCWPDVDWPALPGGGALGDRRRDRRSPGDLDGHGGGRPPHDRFPRRSGGHHPGCGAGQADGPPRPGGVHPVGRRRKDHLLSCPAGRAGPEDRVQCVGVQQREGSAALPVGNEQAAGCPVPGVAAGATRRVTGWRLDRERLAAVAAAVAPGVPIVDASAGPGLGVQGPGSGASAPQLGPAD